MSMRQKHWPLTGVYTWVSKKTLMALNNTMTPVAFHLGVWSAPVCEADSAYVSTLSLQHLPQQTTPHGCHTVEDLTGLGACAASAPEPLGLAELLPALWLQQLNSYAYKACAGDSAQRGVALATWVPKGASLSSSCGYCG